MPTRIPTPGIKAPTVRKSSAAQASKRVLGGTASTAPRPAQAKISTGSMGTKGSVKITSPAKKGQVVSSNPKVTQRAKVMPKKYTPVEKPAAGSDAYAKKRYGKNAWNNGMTN